MLVIVITKHWVVCLHFYISSWRSGTVGTLLAFTWPGGLLGTWERQSAEVQPDKPGKFKLFLCSFQNSAVAQRQPTACNHAVSLPIGKDHPKALCVAHATSCSFCPKSLLDWFPTSLIKHAIFPREKQVRRENSPRKKRVGVWQEVGNLVSASGDHQDSRRGSGVITKTGIKSHSAKGRLHPAIHTSLNFQVNGQFMCLDFSMKSRLEERNVLSNFGNK